MGMNMKKILVLLFVLSLIFPAFISAQKLSSIPGSFVDIGFGARPVGMGFAFVGLADDENAAYWNPAGLIQMESYGVAFTHANQLQLVPYNFFAGVAPIKSKSEAVKQSLGLSLISSGDYALNELSIHAIYSIAYKTISAGLALKYRYAGFGNNVLDANDYIAFSETEISEGFNQQIYGTAQGYGLDFGLLYRPYQRFQLGILVRDLYAPIAWSGKAKSDAYQSDGDYDEDLPMEVLVGIALKVYPRLTITTDFQPALKSDRSHIVRLGSEATLIDYKKSTFLLRAGTEQGLNAVNDEKITGGFGLVIPIDKIRLRADYAYLIQDLANSHRISFSIRF